MRPAVGFRAIKQSSCPQMFSYPLVLLVEDDPEIRDVMQDALEGDGFDVVPASNGKQALDFLSNTRPDLVLLDLMMPQVTGWEVLDEMRRNSWLQAVPTVVVTGALRDRPAGISALVRKPFQMPDERWGVPKMELEFIYLEKSLVPK